MDRVIASRVQGMLLLSRLINLPVPILNKCLERKSTACLLCAGGGGGVHYFLPRAWKVLSLESLLHITLGLVETVL